MSLAYTEGKQKFDVNSPVVAFDGTTPFSGVFGLRYSDRPNGFDAQLISTWSGDVLPRSSPLLYRRRRICRVRRDMSVGLRRWCRG